MPETAMLAPDMMVGDAEIARFLFDPDEFRFQRRICYLCTRSKRRPPHFRLDHRIATRCSTLMDWIALREGFANA